MDQRREGGEDMPRRNGTRGRTDGAAPRPRGDAPRRRRPAPVDTDTRRRRTSEEIHTKPRKRRPPKTAKSVAGTDKAGAAKAGTLREAVSVWATRPIAGVPPKHIGRTLVALVTILVLVITGVGWSEFNSIRSSATQLGGLSLGGGDDGAVDVLLVGTDSRNDAKGNPLPEDQLKRLRVSGEVSTSTDTILLVRIPNDGSAATAVSIPRDTYVEVPGLGKSKINAAYGTTRETVRARDVENGVPEAEAEEAGTKAGRQALIKTVGDLTGVTVDHYAEVGLVGFALLTDAVGGVEVCLKRSVREPLSGARFRKGTQTLDGPQALSFVRQRHGLPRGDLDRITRQQVYMASLAQKILSTQTLTDTGKLNELQDAVSKSVLLDDGWDIISFAEQLKDLTGGNIKFATIPIADDQAWSDDGTQSVLAIDPPAVHTFVDRLLGNQEPEKSDNPRAEYTVDVINAGTVDGLAGNVSRVLTGRGFKAGATSNKPMNEFDSLVYADSKDNEGAKQLVSDLGGGITIREDSSLPENHLKVALTNTYVGAGSIVNTGDQGGSDDGSSAASASSASSAPSSKVIKADNDGPVCVN
ncbi:LCP family protein [Gordonia sp. HY002]|uniref:LCP family protein n=1 Tax=Gordonia zhenghanii TaxID=2911516 RepID=UPI001EF0B268|nr:LCP family protein [Gordonia zhenghanii]MCF8570581.1 LCP family protein [Gordonia zhenghanii]MCF8606620.1 LCP family protein [Gordonia zhenghanii]